MLAQVLGQGKTQLPRRKRCILGEAEGKTPLESSRGGGGRQHLPRAVVVHLQDAPAAEGVRADGPGRINKKKPHRRVCDSILIADRAVVAAVGLQQLAAFAETDGWGDTQG